MPKKKKKGFFSFLFGSSTKKSKSASNNKSNKNTATKKVAKKTSSTSVKADKTPTIKQGSNNKNKSSKSRRRNKYGFAQTKCEPHKNHPAFYKKQGNDVVDYVTFTHSSKVEVNDKVYETIPLDRNIDPKERGDKTKKSHVFPISYRGKRSALGEEKNNYSFGTLEDKNKVLDLLETLPKQEITYTSNSKKKK